MVGSHCPIETWHGHVLRISFRPGWLLRRSPAAVSNAPNEEDRMDSLWRILCGSDWHWRFSLQTVASSELLQSEVVWSGAPAPMVSPAWLGMRTALSILPAGLVNERVTFKVLGKPRDAKAGAQRPRKLRILAAPWPFAGGQRWGRCPSNGAGPDPRLACTAQSKGSCWTMLDSIAQYKHALADGRPKTTILRLVRSSCFAGSRSFAARKVPAEAGMSASPGMKPSHVA